jgi:hypothetical protein
MREDPVTVEQLDFSKVNIEPAQYRSVLDESDWRRYVAREFNLLYRDFEPLRPLVLLEDQKERLERARDCLLRASKTASVLAQPYEVVLGNVFFHLGDFDRAFLFFGKSNARDFQFENVWSESYGRTDESRVFSNYAWELSYFCALCRRLQGNYADSVEILKGLYHSTRHNVGAAWWIARFLLEQGKFSDAASWLRAEMKSEYLPTEDWQLSAAIALAEFVDIDLQVDAFDRQLRHGNPGLHQVVLGLSHQFCPELNVLSEESAKHWLVAVTLLHAKPLFEVSEEAIYAKAATSFAVIAEHEIKRCVFLTFKNRINDPKFAEVVRGERKEYFDDKLLAFLVKTKDDFISLNGMGDVIRECQNPGLKIHTEFREHLKNVAPQLALKSDDIRELADMRDPPSHEPSLYSRRNALRAAEICVSLIRCLKNPPIPIDARPRQSRA